MEFPIHWLIIFIILGLLLGVPFLLYRHGKKVGDQEGYIRGFKEGQQSVQQPKPQTP
jgi:Sec-independent protein translocase protein TatA